MDRGVIDEARKLFGATFRDLRKERNITQEELAAMVGVTTPTIGKIEAGKFNYGIDILFKLSVSLGFTINFEIKEEGKSSRFVHQKGESKGIEIITDTENKIVCTYETGRFNDTQKFTFLEDSQINPSKLATIMREFGEFQQGLD